VSYFPIRIKIVPTGKEMVIKTVEDLPEGTGFVVLGTNVQE
jgi:hypothetical protein